jgi:hypothetical protein
MNKPIRKDRPESNGLRAEYEFDYSKAKPNRFAAHIKQPVVAVVLEADVASVFNSSAKVNAQLRSVMARRQPKARSLGATKRRRRTG